MTRAAWLTDLHLNFLSEDGVADLIEQVRQQQPDCVLISGDIAESSDVATYLRRLHEAWRVPIYFVLGNHDFYFGSIATVRQEIARLCERQPELVYLTEAAAAIELAPGVGLVGHDGWADGRYGDYERSLVTMNDYRLIRELTGLSSSQRLAVLNRLGDEVGEHLRAVLPTALQRFNRVILLIHVPPLREACWYEGMISDDWWLPHFACKAAGDAIRDSLSAHLGKQLTVLCGHTHSPGVARPMRGLEIFTGGAEYGQAKVQRLWEFA